MQLKVENKLGSILLSKGILMPEALDAALHESRRQGKRLGDYLVWQKIIDEEILLDCLSEQSRVPRVFVSLSEVMPELSRRLPLSLSRQYQAVVYREIEQGSRRVPQVLLSDPTQLEIIDKLNDLFHYSVHFGCASILEIEAIRNAAYQELDDAGTVFSKKNEVLASGSAGSFLGDESDTTKYIQLIFSDACRKRASDIHIQADLHGYLFRYRIDGKLVSQLVGKDLPVDLIVNRLKSMAGLRIEERNKPQEGRLSIALPEQRNQVDARLSLMPSVNGESVSIRLIFDKGDKLEITTLGMLPLQQQNFASIMKKTNGVLLFVGPTGSGKSTSLYSLLSMCNVPEVKIVTMEDPVERRLPGIEQIEVNEYLTYEKAFRNTLRRDPDIIMVGEIRDDESADISLRAASSGHKVLSTLHATDAIEGVVRFSSFCKDTLLMSMSLDAVASQRLLIRNCPHCREDERIDPSVMAGMGLEARPVIKRGKGCLHCNDTGMLGRVGVFELLMLTAPLKKCLREKRMSDFIEQATVAMRHNSMLDSAIEHLNNGEISWETFKSLYDEFHLADLGEQETLLCR